MVSFSSRLQIVLAALTLVIGAQLTVGSAEAASAGCAGGPQYVAQVIADGATHLWCLDEPRSRTAFVDVIGGPASDFTTVNRDGLTFKTPGLVHGSTGIASELYRSDDVYYEAKAAITNPAGAVDTKP